jgi:CheY-like chemotaxis protein
MEALIALRKSMPGTPIVALTSNEVPGQEQAALNSGACMALTKASSRAVLISKLRELRSMEL